MLGIAGESLSQALQDVTLAHLTPTGLDFGGPHAA